MLDRVELSNAGEPGANWCDRGKAPDPGVDEDNNVRLRSSKKPNPIPQRLRHPFACDHLYSLIGVQPFTEDVVLYTE
jgi:hypothetical protein